MPHSEAHASLRPPAIHKEEREQPGMETETTTNTVARWMGPTHPTPRGAHKVCQQDSEMVHVVGFGKLICIDFFGVQLQFFLHFCIIVSPRAHTPIYTCDFPCSFYILG